MRVLIKVSPRHYERLLGHLPLGSPAHEAIAKATRIDHAVEGVLFEGYNIPCDENQARIILEVAKQWCPASIPEIEAAIKRAQAPDRQR